jgi:hypothetical protein
VGLKWDEYHKSTLISASKSKTNENVAYKSDTREVTTSSPKTASTSPSPPVSSPCPQVASTNLEIMGLESDSGPSTAGLR